MPTWCLVHAWCAMSAWRAVHACLNACRTFALAALVVAWAMVAAAQPAPWIGEIVDEDQSVGPVNPIELRAFVAGVVAQQQIERATEAPGFAGLLVTVVKDGRIFLNQGFGFANLATGERIDPERTLFRIGDIGQVFVYLALQQQIELGRVQLDTRLGSVLRDLSMDDARLDDKQAAAARALSLRQLATLTAQVDPLPLGSGVHESAVVNGLAVKVVEALSHEPFPAYLNRRLLGPLGLRHTTVTLSAASSREMRPAIGYRTVAGQLEATSTAAHPEQNQPAEHQTTAAQWTNANALTAAVDMRSSGLDMARLMIELLQPTGLVLPPHAVLALRERLHAVDARMPGVLFGLHEQALTPRRFGRSGNTVDFHSEMRLYPEQRLGIFVATNSDAGARARDQLLRALTQHYFPVRPSKPDRSDVHGRTDYDGWYVPRGLSGWRVGRTAIWFDALHVDSAASGGLDVASGRASTHFVRLSDDLFRSTADELDLFFARAADGQPNGLYFSSTPAAPYVPAAFLDRPDVTLVWAALPILWLIFQLAFVSVQQWRARGPESLREVLSRPGSGRAAFVRGNRLLSLAWCAASAMLLLGLLGLLPALADPGAIAFGRVTGLRIALTCVLLGALLVLPVCVLMWRLPRRSWMHWATLLAALLLLLWLGHWQLLGYHFTVQP